MFKSFFGFSPKMIRELKRSQKEFDIIHIHGTSNLFPLEAQIAIENWNTTIASSHYHPLGSTFLFNLLKPIYDRLIVPRYLKMVRKVVCVSKIERNIIIDKFRLSPEKLVIIHNGVPLKDIKSFKNKRKRSLGKIHILYFGRLDRYKNIHILIESLKYLPDTFILSIVGEGVYKKALITLTQRLELEGRVNFLGSLPKEKLYTTIHSSHVVVNLSEIEAFGIMVIESLAASKPVIVNNKLGLSELAEYFSSSVIPVDNPTPKKVASIIWNIALSQRKLKVKGLKKFEWDEIIKNYLKVYGEGRQ